MPYTDTVLYLINEYGRDMILRYTSNPNLDLNTPTGPNEPTIVPVTIRGYTSRYKSRDIDGVNIKSDDLRCFVGTLETTPDTDDQIVIGTDTYNIVNTRFYHYGEDIIMYEFTLRR